MLSFPPAFLSRLVSFSSLSPVHTLFWSKQEWWAPGSSLCRMWIIQSDSCNSIVYSIHLYEVKHQVPGHDFTKLVFWLPCQLSWRKQATPSLEVRLPLPSDEHTRTKAPGICGPSDIWFLQTQTLTSPSFTTSEDYKIVFRLYYKIALKILLQHSVVWEQGHRTCFLSPWTSVYSSVQSGT